MKKMEISQMENLQGGSCAGALALGVIGIGLGILPFGAAGPVTAAGMIGIAVGCLD